MSELRKRGRAVISAGKYTQDGKEKTRYVEVGTYFATDHNGRMCIKLHDTAFSDGKWINIYLDKEDGQEPLDAGKYDKDIATVKAIGDVKRDFVPEDIDDKPIDLSEIPF